MYRRLVPVVVLLFFTVISTRWSSPWLPGQFVTVSGSSEWSWNHSRYFILSVLMCVKDCLAVGDKLVKAITVRKLVHLGNHNFSVATINANSTSPSAPGTQLQFLPITHQMGLLFCCELLISVSSQANQVEVVKSLSYFYFIFTWSKALTMAFLENQITFFM